MLNDNYIEAIEMQKIYDFVTFKKCRRGLQNYVYMCNSKLARSNVPSFPMLTFRQKNKFFFFRITVNILVLPQWQWRLLTLETSYPLPLLNHPFPVVLRQTTHPISDC